MGKLESENCNWLVNFDVKKYVRKDQSSFEGVSFGDKTSVGFCIELCESIIFTPNLGHYLLRQSGWVGAYPIDSGENERCFGASEMRQLRHSQEII